MAGHSKWHNIQKRKGAVDSQKAKEFAQLSKLIRIAVKDGKSGNPDFNPRLRLLFDKARAANMPKDKVERAVERGLGKTKDGVSVQEVLYEGYGPGGVGILVQAVTDNPARTSAELKFAFSRHGGSLAGPNAAQFLFEKSADNMAFVALMPLPLAEPDAQLLLELLDSLQALDDVEEVFHTGLLPASGEGE